MFYAKIFFSRFLIFSSILIKLINGFSKGAPPGVCEHLIPKHKVQPQTSHCPYQVLAKIESSQNGIKEVEVTISNAEGIAFRGYVIQARMATDLNSTIVEGKFIAIDELNSHAISCYNGINNTITHSNEKDKLIISTKWIPPPNFNKDIVFLASIVKDFKTFWVNQSSNVIAVNYLSVPQDPDPSHEDSHNQKHQIISTTEVQPLGGNEDHLMNNSSIIYLNFLTLISVILMAFI